MMRPSLLLFERMTLSKIFRMIAYVFVLFAGILWWKGDSLPVRSDVLPEVMHGHPSQTNSATTTEFAKQFEDLRYVFTPRAAYEISGLVVSLHHSDNFFDITHKNDPANTMDVCVVWGPNISTNGYRMVEYDHGDFTCYYHWSTEHDPPFSGDFLSNNHLVPATPAIARAIKDIRVGDQIRLSGELVDYRVANSRNENLVSRQTSLIRTDTGNGACEILYVTDAVILKKHTPWRIPVMRFLFAWGILSFSLAFYLGIPRSRDE